MFLSSRGRPVPVQAGGGDGEKSCPRGDVRVGEKGSFIRAGARRGERTPLVPAGIPTLLVKPCLKLHGFDKVRNFREFSYGVKYGFCNRQILTHKCHFFVPTPAVLKQKSGGESDF